MAYEAAGSSSARASDLAARSARGDFVNRRYRHRGVVDEVERAQNRLMAKNYIDNLFRGSP
jgi:hypothetical protein